MARDLLKRHLRERFVITLVDGETFSGLLDEWDSQHVFLIGAQMVPVHGAQPVDVSGKLILPRARIKYMQRPDSA